VVKPFSYSCKNRRIFQLIELILIFERNKTINEMKKKKPPYGISNYESLITDNYYFVDKTKYIETLEEVPEKSIFFLRPRKFGKSLFISMLQYYYGAEHKDKFDKLFGDYYIGKNPTEKANTY